MVNRVSSTTPPRGRRRALVLALGCLGLTPEVAHAAPPPPPAMAAAEPGLSHDVGTSAMDAPIARTSADLRFFAIGDFEAPSHVMMVYSPEWPKLMRELARHITARAELVLLPEEGSDFDALQYFRNHLPRTQQSKTTVIRHPVDSVWVRDYGPRTLQGPSGVRWVDAVYDSDDGRWRDDVAPRALAKHFEVDYLPVTFEVDGGALISNGEGFCVMTEESWIELVGTTSVSGSHDRALVAVGCKEVLVVPPLLNEPTGHVDVFAQFTGPRRIMLASVKPTESPEDAARIEQTADFLSRWVAPDGGRLRIDRVPMPVLEDGEYYSYINGLQLEDRYVAPSFKEIGKSREAAAHAALERAMPRLDIVTVPGSSLRELEGVVHCATLGFRLPEDFIED